MILAYLIFVWGSANADCLRHKIDFVDATEGLQSVSLPLAMMAAAPKLALVDANGKTLEQCSGATVSDSGNVLTSGHCVDYCLKLAGAYQTQDGLSHIQREKLPDVTCHFRLDDGPKLDGKILAISDCRLNEKILTSSPCKGNDYALLKIEGRKPSGCFRIASDTALPDTNVAAIGSPEKSFRFGQRDGASESNTINKQFSSGQIITPKNSCYKNVDKNPAETQFADNYRVRFFTDRARAGVYYQTTVDQINGSSGGPLIDLNNGNLRGIATVAIGNTQFVECKGGTFYSATDQILSDIKANYSKLDLNEALGCSKNALIKQAISK